MTATDDGTPEDAKPRQDEVEDAPGAAHADAGDPPSLTLSDAIKLAGFTGTGGQAKRRIQAGEVRVNGQVETRRKRRLHAGDEITVDDETFVIEWED